MDAHASLAFAIAISGLVTGAFSLDADEQAKTNGRVA
jgi:hypothetical protein